MQSIALRSDIADDGARRSKTTYGYPPSFVYGSPTEQVVRLTQRFPQLSSGTAHDYIRSGALGKPINPAESWFAVPRRSKISAHHPELVNKVLEAMRWCGLFHRQWGIEHYDYFKPETHTLECLEKIGEDQKGDIIFFQGQTGVAHARASSRELRRELCNHSEFGLGIFEVACILIANPGRLASPLDLAIDCIGDRYVVGRGPESERTTYFAVDQSSHDRHSCVSLKNRFTESEEDLSKFGVATGFVPRA